MKNSANAPKWANEIKEDLTQTINSAKEDIIKSFSKDGSRPSKSNRGPKNTRMMKIQRTAVKLYVEVEKHRHISTTTVEDCYHVWHEPEVKKVWDARAKRTDAGRGYPNPNALKNGVIYWLYTVPKTENRRN